MIDIVWHRGEAPRKKEWKDNGDFDPSVDLDDTWARCNLSHFKVDACVAGEIPDRFPACVVDGYVAISLYYVGYDEDIFSCSYTPEGLQCVHVASSFLENYGGASTAPQSEGEMRSFVGMLMEDLSENGLFKRIREKQAL